MKNNRNQQVILKSRPADIPQADNFAIVASEIPDRHASDCLLKFAINRFFWISRCTRRAHAVF